MVYAYYAVMGGFTVDISDLHDKIPRATVTTNGILFLASHGHFIQITRESIRDKSKADLLAKGLVCVQVLWAIGQTIERKAAGYPITLLEVHTLVHIVCALILYVLWIRKPQDVHDPTVISLEDLEGALAFMVLCSHFKSDRDIYNTTFEQGNERNGDIIFDEPKKYADRYEFSKIWGLYGDNDPSPIPFDPVTRYGPSAHAWSRRVELPAHQLQSDQIITHYTSTQRNLDGTITDYTASNILKIFTLAGDPPPETVLTMYSGQALASGLGPWQFDYTRRELHHGRTRYHRHLALDFGIKITLSQTTVTMLDLAGLFLKSIFPSDRMHNRQVSLSELCPEIRGYRERMLCFREATLKNTLFDYLKDLDFAGDGAENSASLLVSAIFLMPTAYGGVHLGALSIIFPTPLERILWQTSCYVLIAVSAGAGCFALYVSIMRFFYNRPGHLDGRHVHLMRVVMFPDKWLGLMQSSFRIIRSKSTKHRWEYSTGFVWLLLGILATAYIAARLYIVIEAFISLRHVPIGVYQTPNSNFMDYIPHL